MKFFLSMIFSLLTGSFALAGNSVGNGGNTLPNEQPTLEQMMNVLKTARASLFTYWAAANQMDREEFQGLFSTQQPILDKLINNHLEIRMDQPCINENGEESDASSIGNSPDTICISVKRLQSKLTVDNYKIQILALVGHEFSHRIGFNEAQATSVQMTILKDMRAAATQKLDEEGHDGYTAREFPFFYGYNRAGYIDVNEDLQELLKISDMQGDTLPNGQDIYYRVFYYLKGVMNSFGSALNLDWYIKKGQVYASAFNKKEAEKNLAYQFKTMYFYSALCGLSDIETSGQTQCGANANEGYASYLDGFNNQSKIDVNDFSMNKRNAPLWSDDFPVFEPKGFEMRRVTNKAEAILELQDILSWIKVVLDRNELLNNMTY